MVPECLLQTKTHNPKDINTLNLWSAIFAVENSSTKSVNIVILENLAP